MTSRRLWLGLAVAALGASACGDYSNEDLEFMNALPEDSALRVNLPVASAVEIADEAELAKTTHDTTAGLNGLVKNLVDVVDLVRSYPPSARTATSRTWGPIPADRSKGVNLDWETRMIMQFDDTVAGQLDYEISTHHAGNPDTDWPVFIQGWFQAGHTARRGVGHVALVTAAVRAEGLDVTDLGTLDHLEIDYDTLDDPTTITMHVTDLPAAGSADPAPQAIYAYQANAAGQGQMTFDVLANIITLTPAVEDMRIVSQWLATGQGKATLTIVSGDDPGVQQVECWNQSFQATFNSKPWAPMEDVPTPLPADPGALCPTIPDL